MSEQTQNTESQLNIELPEELSEGVYSNLAIISHSGGEFVLDFVRVMPGLPKAKVKARMVMTPQHVKRLLFALQDNVEKYEAVFGPIEIQDPNAPQFPSGFSGPAGFA